MNNTVRVWDLMSRASLYMIPMPNGVPAATTATDRVIIIAAGLVIIAVEPTL
jgi:hypothetical protein